MSSGLLERSSKLVTEAKQSCSSATVNNGKLLASSELQCPADTNSSTATAVIAHAACGDAENSYASDLQQQHQQQQQQQRQRPVTTIGITYHYSRIAAVNSSNAHTAKHRGANSASEVPGYSSTVDRSDRVFDDAVAARAAALKSVEREWEDEIAVNILSLYQTKVASDVKKHIEQQQLQHLQHLHHVDANTSGNASSTAQHVRAGVYLTQRQERELQLEREAEQQHQQQQQQQQQQRQRSPSRSPQRTGRDTDRSRCALANKGSVSLEALNSTAATTTANSSLMSTSSRKVTASTREQRSPIVPVKVTKPVAKPIVIPVRPVPIWFAGTGAVHAEWEALPGGRDVKRQLQTLEDQGTLS
jgi:hypothetical protein